MGSVMVGEMLAGSRWMLHELEKGGMGGKPNT